MHICISYGIIPKIKLIKICMRNFDLNLVKVLCALIEHKNTRIASEALEISQPAISRALGRLRIIFDDELFIRTQTGLEPTPRALEIGSHLPKALDQLMLSLEDSMPFKPEEQTETITIAANDFVASWLAPLLVKKVFVQAPNVKINIVSWDSNSVANLQSGKVQIAINYFPLALPKNLVQRKIGTDDFVLAMRKSHPLDVDIATVEHLQQYPIATILIADWNDSKDFAGERLVDAGYNVNTKLRSTSINVILRTLESSDMIFPCSKYLVPYFGSNFRAIPLQKIDIFPSCEICVAMANNVRNTPMTQWLQSIIRETLDEVLCSSLQ
ncbi:LysR family transcriptional regulator [Vibrio sp. JPW-9-11-11]|nr:LysR family transcriptional regulator [Vibrio sp. JPW-9-11-11]